MPPGGCTTVSSSVSIELFNGDADNVPRAEVELCSELELDKLEVAGEAGGASRNSFGEPDLTVRELFALIVLTQRAPLGAVSAGDAR